MSLLILWWDESGSSTFLLVEFEHRRLGKGLDEDKDIAEKWLGVRVGWGDGTVHFVSVQGGS